MKKDPFFLIKLNLGALVVVFFIILTTIIAAPIFRNYIIVLGGFFSMLGFSLIALTFQKQIKGTARLFLLLCGGGAAAFFISILLHNLTSAFFVSLFGPGFWERIGTSDEPFFFFGALLVSPLVFLIGTLGSTLLLVKKDIQSSYERYKETDKFNKG